MSDELTKEDPQLKRLLAAAKAYVQQMSPEAYDEMLRHQRASFVRGQIGMGSDADEAEYARALRDEDTEALARLDAEAADRVARAEAHMKRIGMVP